ncbi:hypothetical protein [Alteromonas sp. a30]|uniref:hypothetical protein n=1 Tax=Alteromonas sp. a30 TaxID=2730917 RepID=UPI00227DF2FE|nr:hypothetical protein [Alteromonas sp. a30]MCY7296132.1 hypothetical protein [Alteromonas sp. a30]
MFQGESVGIIALIANIIIPFIIGILTFQKTLPFSMIVAAITSMLIAAFFQALASHSFFSVAVFLSAIIAIFSSWAGRALRKVTTN